MYTLAPLTCVVCGVRFGIDAEYVETLRKGQGGVRECDHADADPAEPWKDAPDEDAPGGRFCCPNGHVQYFTGATGGEGSEIEQLKEELARVKQRAERLEARAEALERMPPSARPYRIPRMRCIACGERKGKRGFRRVTDCDPAGWWCADCRARDAAARELAGVCDEAG